MIGKQIKNIRYIVYQDNSKRADKALQVKMNKDQVYLGSGIWDLENMNKVCPLIKEWKSTVINLCDNQNKKIFRELSHIKFPNLKIISIGYNEIESIEGLNRVQIPALQQLSINDNKINNFEEFKKMNSRYLKTIQIYNNQINKGVNSITKMKMLLEIQSICVVDEYNNNLIQDLKWICKLQSKQIRYIGIGIQQKISQKVTKITIKKKYQNVVIQQ